MTVSVSINEVRLTAEVIFMGRDLCVAVTGGDAPHLGCAALAIPHPGISDPSRSSATVSTLNLPAHRDGEIANEMAKTLCIALGHPIAVLCGIHFDSISPALVQDVHETAAELSRQILSRIDETDWQTSR